MVLLYDRQAYAPWHERYPSLIESSITLAIKLFEPFVPKDGNLVINVVPEAEVSENPEKKSLMVDFQHAKGLPNEFTIFLREQDI